MQGGVSATTTQIAKTYSGTVSSGDKIVVYNSKNDQLLSLTAPKAASYVYFNFPEDFSVKLNGNEILTSTTSSADDDDIAKISSGELLNLINIAMVLMVFLI